MAQVAIKTTKQQMKSKLTILADAWLTRGRRDVRKHYK